MVKIPAFCFKPPRTDNNEVLLLEEVAIFVANKVRERELEMMSLDGTLDYDSLASIEAPPKTRKQLRDEAKEKKDKQRRLDAQRRSEVTRQRQIMYHLIQSDQISKIFHQRAGNMKGEVDWGKDKDGNVNEMADAFASVSGAKASEAKANA